MIIRYGKIIRWFNKWYDYYTTRYKLKRGSEIKAHFKVSNDCYINVSEEALNGIIKETATKTANKYNVKLSIKSINLGEVNDDFLFNITTVVITMKQINK